MNTKKWAQQSLSIDIRLSAQMIAMSVLVRKKTKSNRNEILESDPNHLIVRLAALRMAGSLTAIQITKWISAIFIIFAP